MNLFLCTIDWTAIGSIATAFAVIISLWQIHELKKQRIEDNRARLDFSIIRQDGLIYLKIKNIGKSTAYDINMKISGDFWDFIKDKAEKNNSLKKIVYDLDSIQIKNSTSLSSDQSILLKLYNQVYDADCCFLRGETSATPSEHDVELRKILKRNITLNIKYNGKYSLDNTFSIDDFYSPECNIIFDSDIEENDAYKLEITKNRELRRIAEGIDKIYKKFK